MRQGNVRMALKALRNSRGRSFLTMLGIIIGVVAVVVTVGVGEGMKRQVSSQLNQLNDNVIVIRPGNNATKVTAGGVFSSLQASPLTESDLETVKQTAGVKVVVPFAAASGFAEVNGRSLNGGSVIATSDQLPEVLSTEIEFGTFFTPGDANRHVAVVGRQVAEQLFQENVPIGRTLTIRGQDYIVRGVFEDFVSTPANLGSDLNQAVFIPYGVAAEAAGGALPLNQIMVQTNDDKQELATKAITQRLSAAHGGQQDFTILNRQQELADNDQTVTLITQTIAAIAGLSLLVGGIGIVNIMLVSVTERTREIGIRKAVGATNRQIRNQFLTEAVTLTVVGGLIGMVLSVAAIFLIDIFTTLHPVVPLKVLFAVPVFTWLIGVFFGVAPAVIAARKDPIEALRYE